MIDPNSKLTVLHDDNAVFANHSDAAADYIRDEFSMTLIAAEDYLYLGYTKPFGASYLKMTTANLNANTLALEYWNGTAWTSRSLTDETLGMTRSGFMMWDSTGMSSTTVNSIEAYYVRLKPSADHSATTARAINLVFSDDTALKGEFFEIDNANLLPAGETDHIVTHVAARNTIIQSLRNQQYIKVNADGEYVNLSQWDLFDLFEIRQAAIMLTLSKIFFNLSDDLDDMWWSKHREYQDKYEEAFSLARLTLDTNDDGVKDDNESLKKFKVSRWQR
jgi:hypothetical protein